LQNLHLALGHHVGQQLALVVEDHRGKVEFAALGHRELLIDRQRQRDDIYPLEQRQHLTHQVLGSAAVRAYADAQAFQVGRSANAFDTAPDKDQRLRPRQPADQLQLVSLRVANAVLYQTEMDIAVLCAGDQPLHVFD